MSHEHQASLPTRRLQTLRMRGYMRLITIGGALAMVYVAFTLSPITTDFLRELGATEFQFGLLGGIPMILLGLQFLGGAVAGRLKRRKPWFMVMLIVSRSLYLPPALLPLFMPNVPGLVLVYVFLVCASVAAAMTNFATPLWLSWMADMIPPRILNRYWAGRHRLLQVFWVYAFFTVAALSYVCADLPTRHLFPILAAIGAIAGIADIILFRWVDEPENPGTHARHVVELLTEPLRDPQYRSFVLFTCMTSASMMFAAAFMQIYVLKILAVPRWQVIIIWSTIGLGGALIARTWGRLADAHGHRPILVTCVALKPLAPIAFFFATAENALPLLTIFFFFDSMVNAGYFIAVNGYKLKMAPRENRSMFIAATMALSGIAGGLSAIAAGSLLKATEGLSVELGGRTYINYHLVFVISACLRALCLPLAARIKEPTSAHTAVILAYFRGRWPLRVFWLPASFYRSGVDWGRRQAQRKMEAKQAREARERDVNGEW
ncbi:MAG: MFS transporter [Lentisphaerae bacterium]|nr:MFS transporter [Lentisphaerota bacterium]